MPYKEGRAYVERIHRLTHLGAKKLCDLIQSSNYYVIKLHSIAEQVAKTKASALTNAAHPFNEPGKYGNKYLLVFIDTFSGWVEAFPTKSETAQVVTKKILEEILPHDR